MPKIRLGDVNLYYEISGTGPPLVLVHGLGSSTLDWHRQIDSFSSDYRVVSIDLRGHGQSDKPAGPYGIDRFALDIADLITALGLGAVHLLGFSLGGCVAFELALRRPELVRTLIIVNSGPETPRSSFRERSRITLLFALRRVIVRTLGIRKLGQILGKSLFPKEEHTDLYRVFVERWACNDTRTYLAALKSLRAWSVAHRLGEIDCPTCVIAAEEDYTPVAFKEWYVSKLPNAALRVIPDSRHFTPLDQPERLNDTVGRFLAGSELGFAK